MRSDGGRSLRCTEELLTVPITLILQGARGTEGHRECVSPAACRQGLSDLGVSRTQVVLASPTRGFINDHLDFASSAEGAPASLTQEPSGK